MLARLRRLWFGEERCWALGPSEERCLLAPDHAGFHKSHFKAWPNVAEPVEAWAAIGRRILAGEPPQALSLKEVEYAIDAAQRVSVGR